MNHPNAPSSVDVLPSSQSGLDVFAPVTSSLVTIEPELQNEEFQQSLIQQVSTTLVKLVEKRIQTTLDSISEMSLSQGIDISNNMDISFDSDCSQDIQSMEPFLVPISPIKNSTNPTKNIFSSSKLINEYDSTKALLSTVFPLQFPYGAPYDKILNKGEIMHLCNQGSNTYTDSHDMMFYFFDSSRRHASNKGVMCIYRKNPESVYKISQFINDSDFVNDLKESIVNPTSSKAKQILGKLLPVLQIAGVNVPFGETGGNRKALGQMISLNRWFGNGVQFVTFNPVMHDYILALRLSYPVTSNDNDPTGINFTYPTESIERRRILAAHPNGASEGYIHFRDCFIRELVGIPVPVTGHYSNTNLELPQNLRRGVYGRASAIFDAQELSKAGAQHTHALIYNNMKWSNIKKIISDSSINKKIGSYFDSIIQTHCPLSDNGKFKGIDIKWNSDPANIKLYTNIIDKSNPQFMINYSYLASHKQNHEGHNFTCFPSAKVNYTCRFDLPAHTVDQETSIVQLIITQLEVLESATEDVIKKSKPFTQILRKISDCPVLQDG
jgi:hypothetical protein